MPLYDYRCTACGHRFELLCPVSRRDQVRCEKCGERVERVYQGKCAFGAPRSGCGGNCCGCSGCSSGRKD